MEFGGEKKELQPAFSLSGEMDNSSGASFNESNIRLYSYLTDLCKRENPETPASEEKQLEIFISYPRTKLEWIKNNIYQPLENWRGEGNIFFDMYDLSAGVSWMSQLASAVKKCRIFLPVYCQDYFRSDFCQWELQLALTRDPTGKRRIVIPFMIEKIDLPDYCSLIQTNSADEDCVERKLVNVLGEVLGE